MTFSAGGPQFTETYCGKCNFEEKKKKKLLPDVQKFLEGKQNNKTPGNLSPVLWISP